MLLKNVTKSSTLTKAVINSFSTNINTTNSQAKTSGDYIVTPFAQRPGIGGKRNVTVIPGVGIGPEITESVKSIRGSFLSYYLGNYGRL